MGRVGNIVNGWTSLLLGLNSDIAKDRAFHCKNCQFAKEGKFEEFINDELKEVQGLKCSLCRCPLSAKLRSKKEKCPIGKW